MHDGTYLTAFVGTCGLAIAQGLRRANIPVIVFERDLPLHTRIGTARDWAIACHWSGPTLAKLVGEEKWSRIQEVGVDPNITVDEIRNMSPVQILDGSSGEKLGEMVTGGEPFFRFLRSRLVSYLAEDIDVQYSKTLESFTTHKADGPSAQDFVTAHFTDGTEVKGRLLIGADGAKSRLRSLLFQHDPSLAALKRLPYSATFVNASFTAEQALWIRSAQRHPFGVVSLHPKGRINMLSVLDAAESDKPETWRFNFYVGTQSSIEAQDQEATTRDRLRESKRIVLDDEIADPIKSVYEWLSDEVETAYYTKVANWDPSVPEHKWDNHDGLVTLAGDAAHPMTYREFIKACIT